MLNNANALASHKASSANKISDDLQKKRRNKTENPVSASKTTRKVTQFEIFP